MKKTLSVLLAVGLATTALSACSTSEGGAGAGGAGDQGGGGDQAVKLPQPELVEGEGVLAENGENGYTATIDEGENEETFAFTDSPEIVLGENGDRDAASAGAVQSQLSPARGAAIFAAGTGFGVDETPVIEDVYLALSGDPTLSAPTSETINYEGEYEITTLAIGEDPETSEGLFTATADFTTGTLTGEFFAGFAGGDPKTADLNGTITGSDFTGSVMGDTPEGGDVDLAVQGGFFGDDAETIMGGGTGTVDDAVAAGVFVGDDENELNP